MSRSTRSAHRRVSALLAFAGGAAVFCPSAQAAPNVPGSFTYTIEPDGAGNVVVNGSGNFNTSGATNLGTTSGEANMTPNQATIFNGPLSASYVAFDWTSQTGLTTSFGTGGLTSASAGTEGILSFQYDNSLSEIFIGVPIGYTSGAALSDSSTYDGATLSSLGLTRGSSYQWSWTAGTVTDTVTIDVVPEPATAALIGLPIVLGLLRRRQRAAGGEQ